MTTDRAGGDREGLALIEARGLTKRFGDFTAVDGIDVEVRRGEAFGFLGPNGAGKSSTMRMLGAVSPPSGGSLRIFGLDPDRDGPAIRARLGVCPQRDLLDEELSVQENLWVYGRFFGLTRAEVRARAEELLEFAQLTERRTDPVEPLSGGMKRRLVIARSLINNPELLLLDEPTTGLDPQARHILWDRLFRLKRQGVTLVLTTHYMDEAEKLCDRIAVVDHGKVIARGTPRELILSLGGDHVVDIAVEETGGAALAPESLAGLPSVRAVHAEAGHLVLTVAEPHVAIPPLLARLAAEGRTLASLTTRHASLEDVFVSLTGRHLRDA